MSDYYNNNENEPRRAVFLDSDIRDIIRYLFEREFEKITSKLERQREAVLISVKELEESEGFLEDDMEDTLTRTMGEALEMSKLSSSPVESDISGIDFNPASSPMEKSMRETQQENW